MDNKIRNFLKESLLYFKDYGYKAYLEKYACNKKEILLFAKKLHTTIDYRGIEERRKELFEHLSRELEKKNFDIKQISIDEIELEKKDAGAWKKKHCGGLKVKPRSISKEDLEKLKEKAQKSIDSFDAIDVAMDKLIQEIEDIALKKGSIKAAKMLAKKPLQAALGPLGSAWAAYDVYDGLSTVSELKAYLSNVKQQAQELKKLPEKITKLDNLIKNFDGKEASKVMADIQKNLALIDPCLRARKCMLVPHTQTESKLTGNGGCCDGQTGHHLIPDSYMQDSECSGYKRGQAPTVCVEVVTKPTWYSPLIN